ncbi:hypothetical protein BABINDRAFT_121862 [Babjeviella inositovora NRRL Y-12698]|uniref:Uncharacterized protein n=1 Tax=Babjeviella inositovora NRRL Y-12698 TaxID=984486 RepID=A0A1E3QU87_9ASCO|nr:uncharacterized protein BABINDRAFT_121862 [Babjeviella inositovora NRRL Y-12698]ODQ81258.1 hypothetical protein BABINDRAFT_121862 [Babjeviella inositovora NRRL Y-12698]
MPKCNHLLSCKRILLSLELDHKWAHTKCRAPTFSVKYLIYVVKSIKATGSDTKLNHQRFGPPQVHVNYQILHLVFWYPSHSHCSLHRWSTGFLELVSKLAHTFSYILTCISAQNHRLISNPVTIHTPYTMAAEIPTYVFCI